MPQNEKFLEKRKQTLYPQEIEEIKKIKLNLIEKRNTRLKMMLYPDFSINISEVENFSPEKYSNVLGIKKSNIPKKNKTLHSIPFSIKVRYWTEQKLPYPNIHFSNEKFDIFENLLLQISKKDMESYNIPNKNQDFTSDNKNYNRLYLVNGIPRADLIHTAVGLINITKKELIKDMIYFANKHEIRKTPIFSDENGYPSKAYVVPFYDCMTNKITLIYHNSGETLPVFIKSNRDYNRKYISPISSEIKQEIFSLAESINQYPRESLKIPPLDRKSAFACALYNIADHYYYLFSKTRFVESCKCPIAQDTHCEEIIDIFLRLDDNDLMEIESKMEFLEQ